MKALVIFNLFEIINYDSHIDVSNVKCLYQ